MLQAYSTGQTNLNGHQITVYGPTGSTIGTHPFVGSAGSGLNQSTLLIADDGYGATFPMPAPTPDATNANLNVPAGGGAVCFVGVDCVAWGNFTGSVNPAPGSPASPGGVTAGKALRRSITGGICTGQLDASDDTNNSLNDFSEQNPNPRSSASAIVETSCSAPSGPTVTIGSPKPANPTNITSASLPFTANPAASATFECKLDTEPAFASCTSPKEYAGPLPDGQRTFQVKATNGDGTGPTASYTWTIDTAPPNTSITANPVDPSPGGTSSFRYTSTQAGSTFECKLSPTEGSFSACNTQPKIYSNLADGEYTFEVQARDPAGNVDASPASFNWTVDNSLADRTPPLATITSKPSDPSTSSTAMFTYRSDEPSTFECKLDGAAFVPCAASGTQYTGLTNGPHNFQVRATDTSLNQGAPAGYSWSISTSGVLQPPPLIPPSPIPDTKITRKPGATTRDRTPTFGFQATVAGATFQCKLDGGSFKACRSPFTTKTLTFGRHTVKVRAIAGGLTDPSPAKFSFKVVRRQARHR